MRKIAVLVVVLLAGCDIKGYVVDQALKACEAHKGVHEIITDLHARHVRCNDGAIVKDLHQFRP